MLVQGTPTEVIILSPGLVHFAHVKASRTLLKNGEGVVFYSHFMKTSSSHLCNLLQTEENRIFFFQTNIKAKILKQPVISIIEKKIS